MIHVKTPFALDKNLGRAYNLAFKDVPENDWVCLIDHDVLFLTPNSIRIMYEYIKEFPDAGLFTCLTNRIHPLASDQLVHDGPSENTDIRFWVEEAALLESIIPDHKVKEIDHEISGFLMLISKKVWNKIKFSETGKALGVDNDFSQRVLLSGRKILRMDKLLVWHTYRLNDIKNKKHLL
jgi:GT2 family glycosyltransferase